MAHGSSVVLMSPIRIHLRVVLAVILFLGWCPFNVKAERLDGARGFSWYVCEKALLDIC